MANTTSAKKMIRASERKREVNKPVRSAMRTQLAKARVAIDEKSDDAAGEIKLAVQALDKAAKRGVIHQNSAARRKSRLMRRMNVAAAAAAAPAAPTKPAKPAKPASKTAPKRTARPKTTK